MKKLLFAIAVLGMAASCTLNEFDKAQTAGKNTIKVVAADETRMAIATDDDVTFKHIWEKGDAITVFDNNKPVKYEIVGEGGDVKADFTGDALTEGGPYAVFYPYSEDNLDIYQRVDEENLYRYDYPEDAEYVDGAHVIGGQVMFGTCDGSSVSLKNVGSYVRVSLSAQEVSYLDAIEITAPGGEALYGPAMIGIDVNGIPTCTFDESLMDKDTDYSTFTVKFDDSKWVTANEACFYVALPPVELSKGLEFKFIGEFSGDKEIFLKSSTATLERNTVLLMPNYDVRISYGLLAAGKTFNYAVKKMFNDTVTLANAALNDYVSDIKKIVFKTNVDLEGVEGVDVSALNDGSVIATRDGSTVTVSTSFEDLRLNSNSSYLFSKMDGLTTVENFDKLDTRMVTDFGQFCWNARVLKNIDFSKVDAKYCTSLWSAFCNMYEFDDTHLAQVAKWDTRSVKTLNYAFCATKITSPDFLLEWNLPVLETCPYIFQSCNNITKVEWAGKTVPCVSMSNMFRTCNNLKTADLRGLKGPKLTSIISLFYSCPAIESVDISDLDAPGLVNVSYAFYNCTNLKDVKMKGVKPTGNVNMENTFQLCSSLTSVDFTGSELKPSTMAYTFNQCGSLVDLDLSSFDTSNATSMGYMFQKCSKLKNITVSSKFNTGSVTSMDNMFVDCTVLGDDAFKHLFTTGKFDTRKVTDFRSMFNRCKAVTELDLSSFETPAATRMTYMFNGCSALATLDMRNMTHTSTTSLDYMWQGCTNLKTLRIDKFTLWFSSVYNSMYYITGDTASTMMGVNATATSPLCIWCTDAQVPKSLLYKYSYNNNSYNRKRFASGALIFYYPGKTKPWNIVCTADAFTSATAPTE